MITMAETVRSVFGVYRLARFDRNGLAFLDGTPTGAARSFYCALLLLPPLALMRAINLDWMDISIPLEDLLLVEAVSYVVKWTAFPVAVSFLVRPMGREHRFCHFVSAYNWSNMIWVAVLFPLFILTAGGVLSETAGMFLFDLATILLLIYEGYIIRVSLDTNVPAAMALVVADFLLALQIIGWTDSLLAAATV